MSCPDRLGARAGPDDVQGGGHHACPRCVNEATATFVCLDTEDADPET